MANPYRLPTLGQGERNGRYDDDVNVGYTKLFPRSPFRLPQPPQTPTPARPPNAAPTQGAPSPFQSVTPTPTAPTQPQRVGNIYQPTPPQYITARSAYLPREMPADTPGFDRNSIGVQRVAGKFQPSGDNQMLWSALPIQYQTTLNQWGAAGIGEYAQKYLDAMRAGNTGIIFNGEFMSGDRAAGLIKADADSYMEQLNQANQNAKPRPQPTPFRVVVGGY